MSLSVRWRDKIFSLTAAGFESLAMEVFRFQADQNPVYKDYLGLLRIDPREVAGLDHIPFLPIRFFRTHAVQTTTFNPQIVFESSGTTGDGTSRHLIRDLSLYNESLKKGFENIYGSPEGNCIIGLLPSYLERENSSLVYMVQLLVRQSGHPLSGFYLDEFEKLVKVLAELEKSRQRVFLFGVSFALLDLAERYSLSLQHTTIIETGGMKGRRKEIIRAELHEQLRKRFGVSVIHSEYGMTELLSQAYSKSDGIFYCPPWMKVMVRDEEDPLSVYSQQSTAGSRESPNELSQNSRIPHHAGAINVIDLANIWSCSFIATDDVGKLYADGSFEVLGRMDNSDLRGCSLLVV